MASRGMTKAALQEELRKKKIKFDSKALKADLVKLYESEILKNAAEFSTDDDEPSVKITRSTESKENRLSISLQRIDKMMNDDISDWSDKQLTTELIKHGIKFGPVGPTTRKVYERKLRTVMAEVKEKTPVPAQEYSDQEPSEEEEEEEVVEVVETPRTVTRSQRRKTLEEDSKTSHRDSATKRRPLHRRRQSEEETIAKEPVKPAPQCKVTETASRIPVSVQIIVLVAIAAFLYFVYITMEENPQLLPFRKEK